MKASFLWLVPLLALRAAAQTSPTPAAPTATPVPATPTPVAPLPAPTSAPQDPRQSDTPGQSAPQPGTTPAPTPTPSATPGAPKTLEELTKGYSKSDGLFTLYRKVEGNKQKILAQVSDAQIGPLFLLQSTYATGNAGRITAGRPARDLVWRFQRTPDDRLILAAPNLWYRASDAALKTAVERDFPDAYLEVFPILGRSQDKRSVLIDFSGLFDGSVTGLDTALQDGPPRGSNDSYALDPDLSFIENLKNFPTNLVVEASYGYKRVGPPSPDSSLGGTQADPRSLPVKVTFNLYALPRNDYRPRRADPRVGYFINGQLSAGRSGYESFDDDAASDPRVVYINRWNLRKRDPAAKLSAPVKPILFYLDPSIPTVYRDAVRGGILSWNRAFEPLGFKNAIEVKDAPRNGWDTADMRFNTVRWVASPPTDAGAYAVALLRENPLTGEILNASINVNSNFARVAFQEKEEVVNPLDDARRAGLACELDGQAMEQARLGWETAQTLGLPLDNRAYVNQLLREVVAHEFGHVLGLRHNFVASTYLSPAQLADPKVVRAQGTSASVMDYVGFNSFGLKTGAPLFPQGPGKYDFWAISYGYAPVAASPGAEKATLNRIARRSNEPGLAYGSDELADALDPTTVRYDLSSDPLAYADRLFDQTNYLLKTLGARHPKNGETYAAFTRRLRALIRAHARDAAIATRSVGGVINRRVVAGQGGNSQAFAPVPLAQQRRALDLLARRVLAPNALPIPRAYFSQTQADPYDFDDDAADNAFPLREDVARVRLSVLNSLFSSERLTRIANTTWKFPGQTLGFPELFARVRGAVWGDSNHKTGVSAQGRDLARAHLRLLIGMATDQTPAPADARLVARAELGTLRQQLAAPRKSAPDAMSRLFFADTLRRIDAALAKKPV